MVKIKKFGTFGGVFTPSILTILGVIMYLRLPMIIGEAGFWTTLGIILVAHIISITTGLSVSSIATDKKVESGGTYYMISRSLGLPIGGTLGVALFIGLSFSVSLYLIGFSESFLNFWGLDTGISNIRLTGSIVLLAVTILTFISTSLAIKTQYFIMGAIILSLISIFFGNHNLEPAGEIMEGPSSTISLMVLFGIFFPAVTGFEAGVSMSGDLKNPKKSIPVGAILAILVGLIVYISLSGFLSATVSRDALANDPNILLKISWIPELVVAGIWGATLSSALGSILGAPRILQATAVDSITPGFFAKGYGATNEPRNALLLTFLIAEAGILVGELDVIARIVSIFFITTYGFLNTSAAFESWTSADFRPEFKVPGWISTSGAIACMLVMIQLDFLAMVAAVIILGLLFLYLKRKELSLESGDAWSGVWASLVRTGLTRLKADTSNTRNWRPNIVMFSGNPETRKYMVDLGMAISGKLGVLSAFELVPGQENQLTRSRSILERGKNLPGYFHHKLFSQDVYRGMDEVARHYGFSGVEPNTILMGWSKNPKTQHNFLKTIRNFEQYGFNSLLLSFNNEKKYGNRHSIDIWWSGKGRNLSLAINLVRHITYSKLWKSARLRVLLINPLNDNYESIYRSLKSILDNYRLEAEIKIINSQFIQTSENDIIQTESADTDLVILGIPEKKFMNINQHFEEISDLTTGLGSALLIYASDNFENLDVMGSAVNKYYLDESAGLENFTLPPLELSEHKEIAGDIVQTDLHSSKVIDLFFAKTFKNLYLHRLEFLDDLEDKTAYLDREIHHVAEIRELFRRKKAIDKIKNDFLFKINEIISIVIKEQKLPRHFEDIHDGIGWFTDKLEADFKRYPKYLTIYFEKNGFNIGVDDPLQLRWLKWYKKIKHRITGRPIRYSIHYREHVRHYLLQSRIAFLSQFLEHFMAEEDTYYQSLRNQLTKLKDNLDEVERKIWNKESGWEEATMFSDLRQEVYELRENQQRLMKLQLGRMQLESRKNLQKLNDDLGVMGSHRTTRNRNKLPTLKKKLIEFEDNYQIKVENHLNKILMEFAISSINYRLRTLHTEFNNEIYHFLNLRYIRELDKVRNLLQSFNRKLIDEDIEIEADFEIELKDAFGQNIARMRDLVLQMKDHFDIHSGNNADKQLNGEIISIPLARMTEHYLETRYVTVMEENHEMLIEKIKRSAISVQDAVNLTRFNLENYQSDGAEVFREIIDSCIQKIDMEKDEILDYIRSYQIESNDYLNRIFEPLSSLKIEESADHFLFGLSTYKGKRVLSSMTSLAQRIRYTGQNIITRLLYVRSEGILLSKKYIEDKSLRSSNSRLLDLKEKVNPDEDIVKALPAFYVSLFNGRSSIGDDFWIERQEDEMKFRTALERYEKGHRGGIVILGDRNMGKTAFCKYISQVHLKNQPIYTLFPTLSGNPRQEDFNELINKATQIPGDIYQVASQLKENSVIIINDLELFWERSADGLGVIKMLETLIDTYSHKLLVIANLNPHAYKVINQLTRFGEHFLEIINLKPFDAEELKDLIMLRHRSSGYSLSFGKNFSNVNEIRMAQLFNAYFSYSGGNAGYALNAWLANIRKVNNGNLRIEKPVNHSLSAIKSLDENWLMLLSQFILHKRLDASKIKRITGLESQEINSLIHAMLRSGIITEKVTGLFMIDPYVHPFVVNALDDLKLL
jgi:amino acid transporter/uncharacterized protein YxjI